MELCPNGNNKIAKKEALERERIQEEERAQEEQRVEEQNQATASKTVPGKNKVGRPRKHPRPDVTEEGPPRQKRKYTKRQSGPKTPEEADEDRFDDDGNCIQAKNGSSRKVAYVLKEVTHKREDFTADQLSRPPKNYLQVIFELLKQAEQPLCLPQIYNEMEVQYPYYAFQESKGWQSSVRHNLGQHECFERTKRAGKGWAWTLKPGSSYLKEKKKRAPSPPVAGGNQPIYQAGPQVSGYAATPQKRVIPPNLVAAITAYRNHVANLIRKRAPNDAEAIVDKAINRVYDGTEEDRSLDSTEHEMKLINGVLNILKLPPVPRAPSASQNHSQPQPAVPQQVPQPPINQNKPQGNMSQQSGKPIGADLPKQTIMRPSFFGTNQNQSSNSSVPRPPLMTPVLQRSNSVSAPTPSRPNTASSSSVPSGLSNPPSQTAVSGNNKISGTTPPVASIVNQTIAQPVDQNGANEKGTNQSGATQIGTNRHGTSQNGTNHGLKAGETLTEAGFVRSFPHPPISS
ncbi:fork head domain-containing protein [Botrytis cinerea]